MTDTTLAIVLAFVSQTLASILTFLTFYFRLKHDLEDTLGQVKQEVANLGELRRVLGGDARVGSEIVDPQKSSPASSPASKPKVTKGQ